MTAVKPFPLDFEAGVQRDGTRFDGNRYIDALWCRWRLGRPRKMGGFKLITDKISGLSRRMHSWYQNGQIVTHIGTVNGIQQVIFDRFGALVSVTDRTPAGFVGGTNTSFTFDSLYDTTSNVVQLVAHAGQNSSELPSTLQSPPFLGQIDAATPLAAFGAPPGPLSGGAWIQPNISGGVACIQPYVFDFDNNGLVQWSAPNLANYLGVTGGSTGAGQARISGQKIVAAAALRGGGAQQPAGLFWSLAEVIVASFVGSPVFFAFSTVSTSSSILSAAGVIEYDGLYFWAGVDRFLVFNGAVSELPNNQNQDFFFDNLTEGYEALTFAFKVPRYGEVWWCACLFGSTVPNWAIVFNVRENCWYDTPLPDGGRSAGFYAQGFRLPIMTDVVAGTNGNGLWMHETGTDKVVGRTRSAVRSFYETAMFGGPKNNPPDDRGMSFQQIEPDFDQKGDMTAWLIGAANARSPETAGPPCPLVLVPGTPQEQLLSFTPEMPTRILRLHVESNVIGGSYIGGRSLARGVASEPRLET